MVFLLGISDWFRVTQNEFRLKLVRVKAVSFVRNQLFCTLNESIKKKWKPNHTSPAKPTPRLLTFYVGQICFRWKSCSGNTAPSRILFLLSGSTCMPIIELKSRSTYLVLVEPKVSEVGLLLASCKLDSEVNLIVFHSDGYMGIFLSFFIYLFYFIVWVCQRIMNEARYLVFRLEPQMSKLEFLHFLLRIVTCINKV